MHLLPLFKLLTVGALLTKNALALPQGSLPRSPTLESAENFHKRDGKHITPLADDCKLDFAEEWSAGRSSGAPFCASQIKNGLFVKGFFLFTGSAQPPSWTIPMKTAIIDGITVLYHNGDYTNVGKVTGEKTWVEWDVNKASVVKVNLNPRDLSVDQNLRQIRVVGPGGKQAHGGNDWNDKGKPYSDSEWDARGTTPIHGAIVGIAGKTGAMGVESITFYTLNAKAKKSFLHDVKFSPTLDELNGKGSNEAKGMRDEAVLVGHAIQPGRNGAPEVFHLKRTFSHKKAKSWTHANTQLAHVGIGLEVEYQASVPTSKWTTKGKIDAFWEGSWTKERVESFDKTETSEMWIDVTVQPHQIATVTANFITGELERKWTGKVTVDYENGKTLTYLTSGTLKETTYSEGRFITEYTEWKDGIVALQKGQAALNTKGEVLNGIDTAKLIKTMQETP
ncbi:hypothetical protein CC86DRAFT_409385 [Ophiobolus disseminans]|uniref:Uncharacterized protein n=1 Tax=Ophiobolus disseminans TaxID=1469910 RepID=A0A6A6ZSQ8_9PLEO|nr:hypothetical protein CC86DRAFT_409385 [Ophiobolus disseminans]